MLAKYLGYAMSEKDPWDRSRHDQPPGLDEIFGKLFSGDGGDVDGPSTSTTLLLVIVASLLFIASGFFIVAPAEQAIVLRFGEVYRVAGPGPNWMIPIVDTKEIVNVHKIHSYNYQAEMLTQDENYADVSVAVFYRIQQPDAYLFNSVDPVNGLAQATASALRQVAGSTDLDDLFTSGRETVRKEIELQVKEIIARYNTGIEITDTKLQDARPPAAVKAAFDEVIQAREDYDRYVLQAQSYSNDVLPRAEGQKMRLLNQADAEYERIILGAKAEVAGFNALVSEYRKNPDIMVNRIYLGTMHRIYKQTQKVFVTKSGNMNLLPLQDVLGRKNIKTGDAL